MKPLKLIVAFVVMGAMMVVLAWAAYCIPTDRSRDNIARSCEMLCDEGSNARIWNLIFLQKDNNTDATMMNMAVSGDDSEPFMSAIICPRSRWKESPDSADAFDGTTALKVIHGDTLGVDSWSYSRYWHGYLIPLKIETMWADLSLIRLINSIALTALLLLASYLIFRRSKAVAGAFLAATLLMGYPAVTQSMQFYSCFYIMFLTMIFLMVSHARIEKSPLVLTFFIVGGITPFIDFLTFPLITVTVPVLVLGLLSDCPSSQVVARNSFKAIIAWGAGYTILWGLKWLLLRVIVPDYAGDTAIDAMLNDSFTKLLGEPDHNQYKHIVMISTGYFSTLAITLASFFYHFRNARHPYALLVVALLPYAWLLLMFNHTMHHFWFTYRTLLAPAILSIFCIFAPKPLSHAHSQP